MLIYRKKHKEYKMAMNTPYNKNDKDSINVAVDNNYNENSRIHGRNGRNGKNK